MRRKLLIAFSALMLTGPLLAKEKTSSSGKLGENFALGIDMVTGNCHVQELGADRPPGFKLIGNYDSLKHAQAAARTAIECQGRQVMTERTGDEKRAVAECKKEVAKSNSNLFGLISRLSSGANDDTAFVDCMKARGYGAD